MAAASDTGPNWRRLRAAALRYRWSIVAGAALGTLAGAVVARFRPSYLTQATIWIQTTESRASDRGPIGANQLLAATAWADLVRSYVVLDDVVRERQLYLEADVRARPALAALSVAEQYRPGRYRLRVDRTGHGFQLEASSGAVLEHGTVGDSVGRALGFRWAPTAAALGPGSEVAFTVAPLRDTAKRLADELQVTIDPSGNFLSLALTGAEPAAAAATVNAIAQRYVAVAAELKRAKLTELARLLSEQLDAAAATLRRAEAALEAFRVRTITLPPDPAAAGAGTAVAGSPVSDFFHRQIELDQLRRDQEGVEQVLAQARDSGHSVDGLATIGAVQRSPDLTDALKELTTKRAELRALEYRYTPDHPAVVRLAGDIAALERQTIPGIAQALLAQLAARERVVASELAVDSRTLRGIPERGIEEARLRRDASSAENLYTGVQQRYSEARLAEASSIADVRILDAAVAPVAPVKDTAARFIALGLVAGLGLSLMGAVLADRFDSRVRYPDQVTQDLGLQILGVLPHVKDRGAGPDDQYVVQMIEAMRGVRLSLAYAYGAAGPMVVTVTSPGVGDGKSFVSANLALAYAESGVRTLLIDGDTRRGALHHALQAARKPGLSDFLAGRVPLETITQATMSSSLHFIGAGTRFRDAPELLGSAAMVELLGRLRTTYRVILVDSPPLGSGVDPYTLGTLTGSMVLVLRTGTTNLELTHTKLAMLDSLPIRLLGVVLNDVQTGETYRYYSYVPGYRAADEADAAALTRRRVRGVL